MKRLLLVLMVTAVGLSALPAAASGGLRRCYGGDPPLYASPNTSCAFAGRILSVWFSTCQGAGTCVRFVRSPVTHRRYRITCYFGDLVNCYGRNGIHAVFSGNTG